MTPNTYITILVWNAIAPDVCAGIRASKGVCEHPELWVVRSIDGFGSHMQVNAIQVIAAAKILVFKEKCDTSHIPQAYDQTVAKSDKRFTSALLDGFRFHNNKVMNQFESMLVINSVLNDADPELWHTSFIRVNMCPSKRIPILEWANK